MLPGNENLSSCGLILHPLLQNNIKQETASWDVIAAVKRILIVLQLLGQEVFCMKKSRLTTEVIVVTGFMIALSVVLSKLISINISFLRIGFGFLPIAVLAIMYGPVIAAIGYGAADLLGAWLLPTGTFFPGFTVSAVLTGLIFGWILYKKEVTIIRALIASALVCLIVNLLLNTWWLTFLIGKGFKVLLASRAVKEIVAIPVMALLIVAIDKSVLQRIKY